MKTQVVMNSSLGVSQLTKKIWVILLIFNFFNFACDIDMHDHNHDHDIPDIIQYEDEHSFLHESLEAQSSTQKIYRVAMTAAFVSENGIDVYQEIIDYLKRQSNYEFEFVTGFSYETVNAMFAEGDVDFGFVCGLPYTLLHDSEEIPPVKLIAAPIMKDPRYQERPIYYSEVIVHKDSAYKKFSDLKGSRYVYNEKISNSGYNLPRHYLLEINQTQGYFGKILRSGSHEESIRMVATGKADASSVDSLVLDYDKSFFPQYASQVRVIRSLGPSGIPPVVASSKVSEEIFKKIQNILIGMHLNLEGQAILEKTLIQRFGLVSDENYDSIRMMYQEAEKKNYLEIK